MFDGELPSRELKPELSGVVKPNLMPAARVQGQAFQPPHGEAQVAVQVAL